MSEIIPLGGWDSELDEAIKAIQQPRTNFQLAHFVVGQHVCEARRQYQCVLELQIKRQHLRRAEIQQRQIQRQIEKLEAKATPEALDAAQLMRLDLEDHAMAVLGATREAQCLWSIFKSFDHIYTREEHDDAEAQYWQRRLTMQAQQDLSATGRVGADNQDALRMVGMTAQQIAFDVEAVEGKFLSAGNVRILVAVPTLIDRETIGRDGLDCLTGWEIPGTFERRLYVVQGKSTADAYNESARTALADGAEFLLCVEDDHLIPAGTFEKIWSTYRGASARSIIGAWYPQRKEPRTGSAIVVAGGRREFLQDDGAIHEVYGIPQGFTLIPTAIFREVREPWFAATKSLTQDSFFSQRARDAGYQLFVNTSARIKHVDRVTGRLYE
jgi:hypothetical protein